MGVYAEMLAAAAVAVYVVDVSGFTDAWRGALAGLLGIPERRLRPLPPFDCGKCAAFWTYIVLALCRGEFSVGAVAFAALMSWAAPVLSELMLALRELLLALPRLLTDAADLIFTKRKR